MIIIIIIIQEIFFSPAFSDSLLQESEWHWVSPGLQNPSQYSIRTKQSRSLDDFDLSSGLQLFHSPFKNFEGSSICANYTWYHG